MRIREIKKNKKKTVKPRDPNFQTMMKIAQSGAGGSHGDKTKEIPRNAKHKKDAYDINEKVNKDGVPMCPDACCGVPVSECKCGPECEHCNCHFIKEMKEVVETKDKLQARKTELLKKLDRVSDEGGKVNINDPEYKELQAIRKALKKESINEDAPFDGMGLVQRMVFNKWITVEEWNALKHKMKDAAQEIEDNYDDWPDGEGFGSSDHNFAIKELMQILGYEFDDKDTSGRFVVSKVPPEVEKLGIKNVRMKEAPGAQPGAPAGQQPAPAKPQGQPKVDPKVAQRAASLKSVGGGKASGSMVAKGLGKLSQGGMLPPNIVKAISPYAQALQNIMADPQLFNKFKMLMKSAQDSAPAPAEAMETATPGATSAGNIATVANPHIANSKKKPKTQKPTDNALDNKSHGLFGQPLKRLNNSKEQTMSDKKEVIAENLADEASKVEQDHEVQMARAQLYKIAKYSIKLHEMLKNVSEQEGLEGWVQSKITKSADYIGAVYHNMDYEHKFAEVTKTEEVPTEVVEKDEAPKVEETKADNYKDDLANKLASSLKA